MGILFLIPLYLFIIDLFKQCQCWYGVKTSLTVSAKIGKHCIIISGVTIVDTIDLSRLLQARQSIVNCYFTLLILLPIVETAINFSDSCLCGLKLISFRRKKWMFTSQYRLNCTPQCFIIDLCFVNREYMFKNSSLKLEKATFS